MWKEAIDIELESMLANETLNLIDVPKSLNRKWVFRNKLKSYGPIDKFKDMLVTKGFKQK